MRLLFALLLLALARPALAEPAALDCLSIESGVDASDPQMVWIANACAQQVDYVTRFAAQGSRIEFYSMNYAPPGDHGVDWSFSGAPPVLVMACYTGAADCDLDRIVAILRTLNDQVPRGACLEPCEGFDAAVNEAWLAKRAALEAQLRQ